MAARQERSKAVLEKFEVWLAANRARISAKSPLGESLKFIAKYCDSHPVLSMMISAALTAKVGSFQFWCSAGSPLGCLISRLCKGRSLRIAIVRDSSGEPQVTADRWYYTTSCCIQHRFQLSAGCHLCKVCIRSRCINQKMFRCRKRTGHW